jgi:hypothetical protein
VIIRTDAIIRRDAINRVSTRPTNRQSLNRQKINCQLNIHSTQIMIWQRDNLAMSYYRKRDDIANVIIVEIRKLWKCNNRGNVINRVSTTIRVFTKIRALREPTASSARKGKFPQRVSTHGVHRCFYIKNCGLKILIKDINL